MIGALTDWELTRSGRSMRTYGLRIAALLFAFSPLLMGLYTANRLGMSAADKVNVLSAYVGFSLNFFQMFVVIVGAPVLASMSFADERQGGTLELLVLTGARWSAVIGVKFVSIFLQIILLLSAILPFAAIGSLFGGIDVIAFTGRTVALAALTYLICAAGILASVSSMHWNVSVVRTFGLIIVYVMLSLLPDWLTGNMAGTRASYLLGSQSFAPGAGGAPWESLLMAIAVGSLFLLAAIRITPLRELGTPQKRGRARSRRVPDSPTRALAKLVELTSIRAALPWTRAPERLIVFIGIVAALSVMMPGFSFFLYGLASYSAAATVRQLSRSGTLENLRLVARDRQLARLLILLQLRWGSLFMLIPLTAFIFSIFSGTGSPSWQFQISNALLMGGFLIIIIAIASLASTFRGGVAMHTFAAFGLSYLAIISIVITNGSSMSTVLEGVWMGTQAVFVAAIAFFLFALRFPHRMPAA